MVYHYPHCTITLSPLLSPKPEAGESMSVDGVDIQANEGNGLLRCSCEDWRRQNVPENLRTCRHLRAIWGDFSENLRTGGETPGRYRADGTDSAPGLLLAKAWEPGMNPAGWWISEKLDGVRAYWNGSHLVSRNGNNFAAPEWFTAGLPAMPLDGELFIARKSFQTTQGICRMADGGDAWKVLRYVVFDAPEISGGFEERMLHVRAHICGTRPEFARVHPHRRCAGAAELAAELDRVEALGGEGLMLRQPESDYYPGRSDTLQKVKRFKDADALVVEHLPGQGRHRGRLGALRCRLADGTEFNVGSGLSDGQRACPPAIGATITFRYQEMTDGGVPRFASFVGVRMVS